MLDAMKRLVEAVENPPENPYPASVFTMTVDGYVAAIPDRHLRTAISGHCGRFFWDLAIQEYRRQFIDALAAAKQAMEPVEVKWPTRASKTYANALT